MPGQLFTITQIGKQLKQDYASLTAIASNPPELNSLVPYLRVIDSSTKKPIYDSTKWIHTHNPSDVIIDLIDMDIEVGKNGFPSLIGGTIKFKILNANKFITENNAIRYPELFALMSHKIIDFGWADMRFSKFSTEVIESKFETSSDNNNTLTLTMHVGSILNYLNKIEHAFVSELKNTSNLNIGVSRTFSVNYSGRIPFSNEVITNIIDQELKKPYKDISYLKMFDNILFDFDSSYPYRQYDTEGVTQIVPVDYFYGIRNLFSKWFSYAEGSPIVRVTEDAEDFYRFDGNHHWTESWYSNHVDFSSFNINNRTQLAIVPRISEYHFVDDNSSPEIKILRTDVSTLLNLQDSRVYGLALQKLESNSAIELFQNPIDEQPYKAIPDAIEAVYYREFLLNKNNSPFVKNYNFNSDGTELLSTDGKTIERDRLEILSKKHIEYILELRKIVGEVYSAQKGEIKPLDIKLKIRELYTKLSSTTITDEFFIKTILKPKIVNIEQYNFNRYGDYDGIWDAIFGDPSPRNPKFGIYESDIIPQNEIRVIDLVTLLELNYRLRSKSPHFYNSDEWRILLSSLDNLSKKTGEEEEIKKASKEFRFTELDYFFTSNNLNSIYDCILYLATVISNMLGINNPKDWDDAYYIIMMTHGMEQIVLDDMKKAQEQEQKVVDESANDRLELLNFYESPNQLRLSDIVSDLNNKMEKSLNEEYKVTIKIFDGTPNISNIAPELNWTDSSGKPRSIKFIDGADIRLENLLLPTVVYTNILSKNESLFGILGDIFKHFGRHFNINLAFSVFKLKGGDVQIEIFCLDLIKDSVDSWDGGTDFSQIDGNLSGRFVVFDYRANNSIITNLTANVQTQDSLFLSFMPAQTAESIVSLFGSAVDKESQLTKEAKNVANNSLVKIYKTIFKDVKTADIKSWKGMLNNVQQYASNNNLENTIKELKLGKNLEFLETIISFYNASGTYPAHLLFGGYSITLELLGINGFASFQLIGLRNAGLYDGVYMVEKARHFIDKTTFKTSLECKLLVPRIRSFPSDEEQRGSN